MKYLNAHPAHICFLSSAFTRGWIFLGPTHVIQMWRDAGLSKSLDIFNNFIRLTARGFSLLLDQGKRTFSTYTYVHVYFDRRTWVRARAHVYMYVVYSIGEWGGRNNMYKPDIEEIRHFLSSLYIFSSSFHLSSWSERIVFENQLIVFI